MLTMVMMTGGSDDGFGVDADDDNQALLTMMMTISLVLTLIMTMNLVLTMTLVLIY